MKKFLATTLLAFVAVFFATLSTYASGIGVNVNGQNVNFDGQTPIIVDGSTFVPIRGVFEQLGFNVSWDGQVILENSSNRVVIPIGNTTFTINGIVHTLDTPAQIIGGSTMLPLRAVLEPLDYSLDWNADTQTITITSNLPQAAVLPPPTPQPTPVPIETPQPAPAPVETPQSTQPQISRVGTGTTIIIFSNGELSQTISGPFPEIRRNENVTLVFHGEPNTSYELAIWSAASPPNRLTASGLGTSISDDNGMVSWTWLVGGRSAAGNQRVQITGAGKMIHYTIVVVTE
ncbi:MAG: copper amine oxidase N-terminal domain-containing protein [Defluviitaleaceae bacterium]|nr:copper amine oxidase N-terminal domain-containing protein [Defluviitaleaceae bacterium]